MTTYKDYLQKISPEELNLDYNTNLLTRKELCVKYNISNSNLNNLLKHYQISKSNSAHMAAIKKAKLEHFGFDNYNGHIGFVFELSAQTEQLICQKYLDGASIRQLNEQFHTHKAKLVLQKNNIKLRTLEEDKALKRAKIKSTCLSRYGVDNPAKNDKTIEKIKNTWSLKDETEIISIKNKSWKKYFYNDVYFDSSWELYYYIWNIDLGNCILRANIAIPYTVNGQIHKYIPDFIVNGKLVEIKGDHLLEELKTSSEPLIRAKYECMIKNNVTILSMEDLSEAFNYVNKNYKESFIEQFKL